MVVIVVWKGGEEDRVPPSPVKPNKREMSRDIKKTNRGSSSPPLPLHVSFFELLSSLVFTHGSLVVGLFLRFHQSHTVVVTRPGSARAPSRGSRPARTTWPRTRGRFAVVGSAGPCRGGPAPGRSPVIIGCCVRVGGGGGLPQKMQETQQGRRRRAAMRWTEGGREGGICHRQPAISLLFRWRDVPTCLQEPGGRVRGCLGPPRLPRRQESRRLSVVVV